METCAMARLPSVFLSTPSARRATGDCGLRTYKSFDFYPRPPRGGRRQLQNHVLQNFLYFYPRPPRGGRPCSTCFHLWNFIISIHALREEGDVQGVINLVQLFQFLSTPSARRATRARESLPLLPKISIHALREEGDLGDDKNYHGNCISIHALREEGDLYWLVNQLKQALFLSTPSARRATVVPNTSCQNHVFLSTPSARRATWTA